MTTRRGLESLHITGWVSVKGAQSEIAVLGITSGAATMRGREHEIALDRIGRICADGAEGRQNLGAPHGL